MIKLSLSTAQKILDAELVGDAIDFVGVQLDTRLLESGNLFVALKGEKVDAHDFLGEAKEKGAVAALVSRKVNHNLPQIVVPDVTIAFGKLAHYWREQFKLPVIGITGSCGKTTTTQMLGAICNAAAFSLIPTGNNNNELGVPLTLCRLSDEHHYAVIEMGAKRKGDINYLAHIVQPTIALITNIAPVHLDVPGSIGFETLEGVYVAKSEIYSHLPRNGSGVAIVNADDDFYPKWCQMLRQQKMISFGFSKEAQVSAHNLAVNTELQYSFDLVTLEGLIRVQLSSVGRHNVINALAAAAAALAAGIKLKHIAQGLANVPTMTRRMVRSRTKNGAILIDDSYNANLRSVKAIIDMLAEHPGKKILIVGDMLEIGLQSPEFHRQIGEYAKKLKIDYLIGFGKDVIYATNEFGKNAHYFTDHEKLVEAVNPLLDEDVMVAVKGSFGMKMDRIVSAFRET
ncbi:MAG: UDP-N-acetylmuramoyl-tripeptide--D-alanyl-D-alanine ligase [Gammaproteobacteria bacterium]|nr:UDP-N-acetylmuramoyl-tripeptide--D-alanyl-D-alanine ligase [Gammaproteobacteria bacterium]